MRTITFAAFDTLCTISIFGEKGEGGFLPGEGRKDKCFIGKQGEEACLPGQEKEAFLLEQAKALVLSVQDTLNMYDPKSELSRLCASYIPGEPQKVSPMLWEFIQLNVEFSRQTGGMFDFTVGPLVKLWDVLAEEPKIPEGKMLKEAMERVGCQHIHLLPDSQSVIFDRPGMVLDPGASGKGFGLGLAADFLKKRGIKHGILDFGGNLFAIGGKPGGERTGEERAWRVGIRHPDKPAFLGPVELADRGIATSSWYEHCFQKEGKIYHHLLNPFTGKPQETDISSVSILSSRAVYTDLLSTAFFVMGAEKGCKLAEELEAGHGVDVGYVVLKRDGSSLCSLG